MDALWKSNMGKLFIGGCGTQVGMALTCGMLTVFVLFGVVCMASNAIAFGIAQQITKESPAVVAVPAPEPVGGPIEITVPVQPQVVAVGQPARPSNIVPVQAASNPKDIELLQDIESLLGEIERYRTRPPENNTATNLPQPVLVASRSGVDLLSGPGEDYNRVAHLPIGQSLEIVGRNPDSSWWLVSTPQGAFAWVSAKNVATFNASEAIPVVTIPALLVHPASASVSVAAPGGPSGTPTPTIDTEREYVENMPAYKRLRGHLLVPPVSESVSPDGRQVAITERIKLYTLGTEGALTKIWFEDDDEMGPIGGAVWSPDGRYIAFVVGFKTKYCRPCRAVALLNPAQETITFLDPPRSDLDTDMPRWTQDGRLMVNAHPGEPADGVAYVYDVSGHFEEAEGLYELSSSHEGQKWYPWLPGRTWRAGVSERADSYNSD